MVMRRGPRLGPEDWIAAGLEALAQGGVDAVRVDVLAKTLGVTRGSFYWHFGDRRALLDGLLAAWGEQQTDGVIARAQALGKPPRETLRALLGMCFEDDGRLERALRSWAATDGAAAEAVQAVDGRRIAYLAALLAAMGFAEATARTRARIAYRAWLGDYALVQRQAADTTAADVEELHALLVK